MATITIADRRARLARRHRLAPGHRAADVEEAAESIVCLHATNHASVHLSAWARVDDLRREDVDRALFDDRTLVKQLAMRRTLFVFPRATLAAAVRGPGVAVAAGEARTLIRDVEAAGLHVDGARWLGEATAQVLEHLSDGRSASWLELRGTVPLLAGTIPYGEGRSWGRKIPVGPRGLTVLSAQGEIVRAGIDGGWMTSRPRWASMSSWLGAAVPEVDPDRAREELVTAWLRAFGPGTEQDVKWWLGDTLTNTRAALRAVGAVAVDLEDGGDGAAVGLIALGFPRIVGSGYPLAQEALTGDPALSSMAAILVARFALTLASYGTGAAGGLFAPLLVIGAELGRIAGDVAHDVAPGAVPDPATLTVAGMAAVFVASVRAPLTGVVLILEMTGASGLLLPTLIACAVAYVVPSAFGNLPVYEELRQHSATR